MDVRLGCPVARPSKIICLGINYATHGAEGGFKAPERPILFAKTPNTLNGPFDPIVLPRSSGQVDWEVELAVIIGREAKRVRRAEAFACIAGYASHERRLGAAGPVLGPAVVSREILRHLCAEARGRRWSPETRSAMPAISR